MTRRRRLLVACAALAAACPAGAAPAQATTTTDINSWSLNESWKYYGGGTQYRTALDGDGTVDYRWADSSLTKTTIIAAVSCADYTELGRVTIQGGDTSFRQVFDGFNGQCFVLRGKTQSGTTDPHDGRIYR